MLSFFFVRKKRFDQKDDGLAFEYYMTPSCENTDIALNADGSFPGTNWVPSVAEIISLIYLFHEWFINLDKKNFIHL